MTWFWLLIAAGVIILASSFANVELANMALEQAESFQLIEAILP